MLGEIGADTCEPEEMSAGDEEPHRALGRVLFVDAGQFNECRHTGGGFRAGGQLGHDGHRIIIGLDVYRLFADFRISAGDFADDIPGVALLPNHVTFQVDFHFGLGFDPRQQRPGLLPAYPETRHVDRRSEELILRFSPLRTRAPLRRSDEDHRLCSQPGGVQPITSGVELHQNRGALYFLAAEFRQTAAARIDEWQINSSRW